MEKSTIGFETNLKENFHRLGAGILGRFMDWIIAIVAGLSWTRSEFRDLNGSK